MSAQRRPGSGRLAGITIGVLLAAAGSLLVATLLAPQAVERAYGTVKVATGQVVESARAQITGEVPTVALGATGHIAELDRCDGTFTQMTSYENDDVPAVWAAHNNCGGDVLLPWELGQLIRVEGSEQIYAVVDIRDTSKTWGTVDDLVGLEGDLALQTCHYGEDRMKFIGLRPIDG